MFYGRRPIEEMPHFYAMASAMLVTLSKNDIISKTLPGKVQSYMCAGKPILASIDGETQTILDEANCGMYCNSEDFASLAKIMVEFKNKNQNELSNNSRNYYINNFSKELFFERLEKITK